MVDAQDENKRAVHKRLEMPGLRVRGGVCPVGAPANNFLSQEQRVRREHETHTTFPKSLGEF